ncbi:unnamed protein product [Brachionus calyciflorus]|uniref:Reverse transcriptase domain-containing protein n=1 Tax=Brachionus calyciflorus TaxID=104777 RepID=A0A814N6C2_9BILA|nr:unnamed protein product [Brachionus calyciflorus]
MSVNSITNTPQHASSGSVTKISETSKPSRVNTSPSSPPEDRFLSIIDFSTWKTKIFLLETLVHSKDKTIVDLSEKITELTDKVQLLENELKEVKDKASNFVVQAGHHQQQQLEQQTNEKVLNSWVSVANRALAQVEGKKVERTPHQIERNVIVFGFPVSTKNSQESKDADDKGFIERAFRAIKADIKKIKSIRRFRSNSNSNRPPPILIQLHSDGDRPVILKAAKKLRKLTEYSEVFINPDMTEAERILDKKRREDQYNLNQQERIASILNEQFKSVFNKDISDSMPSFDFKTDIIFDPNVENLITEQKILEKLNNLDIYKDIGPDKIHETIDFITEALANGFPIDIIYTDFAKAFDKVSHKKLLYKLKFYGFGEGLIKWIRSFLSYRKQRVVLGNVSSEWVDVVPQGSVLGPLLFFIYINDMLEKVLSGCKAYADDTKLLSALKKFESIIDLQDDIDKDATIQSLITRLIHNH